MRYLAMLLLGAVFMLGCPQPADRTDADTNADAPDEFDTFSAVMRAENGFRDELKRLQGLYTVPANLGNAATSGMSARYRLGSRVENGRIGLVLNERTNGEEWVLWGFADESIEADSINVINDEDTAGGYRLEFNIAGGALTISITARWLQGRFLQINREIMLGGLDHELWAPSGYTSWSLDGPWQPYRLLPATGARGAYGVVDDRLADGNWQAAMYPQQAMVPALATYDRKHGMLLMVVDEHPRRLDRDYELGWRVDPEYSAGEQIRIAYRVFDPTKDAFGKAYLISGLPVRDSLVLEPFDLFDASADSRLVYAETREVITHLGQLTRCFHFSAQPPERVPPGGLIEAAQWVSDPAEIGEFIRVASGIRDVRLSLATFHDAQINAGGYIGLGAAGLGDGAGLGEAALSNAAQFDPEVMPVLAAVKYLRSGPDEIFATLYPEWLVSGAAQSGNTAEANAGSSGYRFDVRRPETAAWMVRKMADDIAAYPQIGGYCFADIRMDNLPDEYQPAAAVFSSSQAAGCAMYLRTAEAVRAARDDALLAVEGGLRLALPYCGNYFINRDRDYDNALSPGAVSESEPADSTPARGAINHAARYSSAVCWEVFGAPSCLDFGSTPAAQLIATGDTTYGYSLHPTDESFAGFQSFAKHQRELRESGGELLVIHSEPEYAAYPLCSERPAVCSELVALLPAQWESLGSLWIAFYGTVGTVIVDERNMLTVTWNTGGAWERILPPGYWVVEHPEPLQIAAGDVVLVLRKPLRTVSDRGGVGS